MPVDPMLVLGLVQLGLNIWGSLKANEEASQTARAAEELIKIRNQRFQQAVSEAYRMANMNLTGEMSPYYAAALSRLTSAAAADAGAAGLAGGYGRSGLTAAALGEARANVGAQFAQNAAQVRMQQRLPLIELLGRGATAGSDELSYRLGVMQQQLPQGGGLNWLAPLIEYYKLQAMRGNSPA